MKDLETLKKARPYLRTLLAILIGFNKKSSPSIADHYKYADVYLENLEKDVRAANEEDPL